jgi:hypothetical protein
LDKRRISSLHVQGRAEAIALAHALALALQELDSRNCLAFCPNLKTSIAHKPDTRSEITGTTAAAGQADTKQGGMRPHREPDVPLQEAGPQLQEEQEVWDKIEQELVRQVGLHCHERGLLLSRARSRRAEIMQVPSPPYTMIWHII